MRLHRVKARVTVRVKVRITVGGCSAHKSVRLITALALSLIVALTPTLALIMRATLALHLTWTFVLTAALACARTLVYPLP